MATNNTLVGLQEFKLAQKLMGNHFEITVVADDEQWAHENIRKAIAEIQRIENLLSTFKATSETNQINEAAGQHPIKVSAEMLGLVQRSLKISALTDGAFDITYGSIDKSLWNFDKTMAALPDAKTAASMVRLINYKNVIVDAEQQTIFLKEAGMRIGFGGIGKGYAAEMAKQLLIQNGVTSGIVNASGDLTTWGVQANGQPWRVGIANPDMPHVPLSHLQLSNMAIATSGNYEKFVIIDGKKYSHTINPRTGLPVNGIKSVTIISPNAELADALATPVTIMGVNAGLHLINQIHHLECIIITDDNNIYTSKNIHLN
ncbi:FAD:protein FMN transferase [Ferruginibacter yonginensis]|uniref:FAD:protein FMN transferase n=1 Tax=Ferruginibacter yonginensis TaxID=1310416 RepID=A0ABV8QUP3_9BACT